MMFEVEKVHPRLCLRTQGGQGLRDELSGHRYFVDLLRRLQFGHGVLLAR